MSEQQEIEGVEVRGSAISDVIVRCTADCNDYVEIAPSERFPGCVVLDVCGVDGWVYLNHDRALALADLLKELAEQEHRKHG